MAKGKGWHNETGRHKAAALKGWDGRRNTYDPVSPGQVDQIQDDRSRFSQVQDSKFTANERFSKYDQRGAGKWAANPGRYDIEGVDTRTIEGQTINTKGGDSRVGQEAQEKSTMNEMKQIDNRYDGIARIKVKNINADIDKHNKLVQDSRKNPDITDKMILESSTNINNSLEKAKKSMSESDDRRVAAKVKKEELAKSKIESPARTAIENPIPKTTSTKMQYQRSNGSHGAATLEQSDDMINRILKRESWYAERVGRKPMTTKEQVITRLQSGESLNYGNDWYKNIRIAQPPISKAKSDAYDEMERKSEKRLNELDHDIY